ncbi:unnamed protein product [Camellia sinensis]
MLPKLTSIFPDSHFLGKILSLSLTMHGNRIVAHLASVPRPSWNRFIVIFITSFFTIFFATLYYQSLFPTTLKVTPNFEVFTDVYHSSQVFGHNYEEMERNFKIYVYPDGDPKTYYQTPKKLKGKYASEGYFFQNIRESRFRTDDPEQAHLFFIPISCQKMRGLGASYENMTTIVQNYVQSLILKYPYWNRTLGTDHFFVTCHDVGVRATEGVPLLVKNSIRVVCSPSYEIGFIPHKDVPLPQVLQPFALPAGGNDTENRKMLGFWAGHRNSEIRAVLANEWENDTELDIQNNRITRGTGHLVYLQKFYTTKFCICPGGSQVNSDRIADSIHYGCVPVILSNYYDLPFNDILNWWKFSVILNEHDVYGLKYILKKIPESEFIRLHYNLVKSFLHQRSSIAVNTAGSDRSFTCKYFYSMLQAKKNCTFHAEWRKL